MSKDFFSFKEEYSDIDEFVYLYSCNAIKGDKCLRTLCKPCADHLLKIVEMFGYEAVHTAIILYEAMGSKEPFSTFIEANGLEFLDPRSDD